MKIFEVERYPFPPKLEAALPLIRQACAPFLDAVRAYGREAYEFPMFRGDKRVNDTVTYYPPRSNRPPKDMDPHVSREVDDIFKMHFGYKFRSEGYFATGYMYEAMGYGTPCYCFPAGDFKFCWSNVYEDMYMSYDTFRYQDRREYEDNGGDLDYYDEADAVRKFIDDGRYRTDDIQAAIQSKHEIMFISNGFYLLQMDDFIIDQQHIFPEWCKAL